MQNTVGSRNPKEQLPKGYFSQPLVLISVYIRSSLVPHRAMTESTEEKKERNTVEELQKIGPLILNCHRSERQRQNRAALELKAFCKFLANSYADGRKGANEMEDALRYVKRGSFSFNIFPYNVV